MRVYALKTCDTCKKAIKALRTAGHDPQVIDVRDDGISAQDRARLLAALGDALVNRASTTWRALSEAERARDPADLLADHPTLMKRPVIETDDGLFLGWKADVQKTVLG